MYGADGPLLGVLNLNCRLEYWNQSLDLGEYTGLLMAIGKYAMLKDGVSLVEERAKQVQ